MMTEIAASVAKALGLEDGGTSVWIAPNDPNWEDESHWLHRDGSNLFAPYWQVRGRDWLLERGYITMGKVGMYIYFDDNEHFAFNCPAAEFCARAIHALIRAPVTPEVPRGT